MAELYTLMVDDKPVAYAYGEEWVAVGLYMDDIKFKTPEEAKAWWEEWEKIHAEAETNKLVFCKDCEFYIAHDKRCAVWNHGVHKDDYCSRWLKKEVKP